MKLDATLELGAYELDLYLTGIVVLLVAIGTLGGVANYFLQRRVDDPDYVSVSLSVIWGVVAALTIPMFLSMISSDLIDIGRYRPAKLLVLTGFGLFYILMSRYLFEAATASLRHPYSFGRNQPKELSGLATGRGNTVTMAGLTKSLEPSRTALLYGDFQLLEAVAEGHIVYGNLSELLLRCSLDRDQIIGRLAVLKAARLIETRMNHKSVLHWIITAKGRQLLDEVAVGEARRETVA